MLILLLAPFFLLKKKTFLIYPLLYQRISIAIQKKISLILQ